MGPGEVRILRAFLLTTVAKIRTSAARLLYERQEILRFCFTTSRLEY